MWWDVDYQNCAMIVGDAAGSIPICLEHFMKIRECAGSICNFA